MNTSSRWTRTIPLLAALVAAPMAQAHTPRPVTHSSASNALPAPDTASSAASAANGPTAGTALTPAQRVAMPDGDAPPPPHGYAEVEDTEMTLANFSSTVRTHAPLGLPGPNAQQKTNGPNNVPSHFSLFGVPVIFNTPVRPPYQDEDTPATYAGHPSNGQTDILVNGDASPIH